MTASQTMTAAHNQSWNFFRSCFWNELGAQIADRLREVLKRGAHFGLKLAIFGAAFVKDALGKIEPRLMPGERHAKLGALHVEIGRAGSDIRRRSRPHTWRRRRSPAADGRD